MTKYDTSIGYMVVNSKDEFLLLQKTIDNVWDFPKGHPNEGETDELIVAAREFEEETNIKIEFLKQVAGFRHEHTFVNPKGVARKIILFLARCDIDPKISPEHKAFVWVNIDKAKELIRFKEKIKSLEEAYAFLKK